MYYVYGVNALLSLLQTALQCGPPAATGSAWTTRRWMNLNTLLEGRRTLTRATILSHLHVDWKTHVERAVLSLKMPHGR